ncbi:hypothetical protein ACJX0J_040509, partial [Zea mays]
APSLRQLQDKFAAHFLCFRSPVIWTAAAIIYRDITLLKPNEMRAFSLVHQINEREQADP